MIPAKDRRALARRAPVRALFRAGVRLSQLQKSPAEAGLEFRVMIRRVGSPTDPYFETNSHAPSSRYPTLEEAAGALIERRRGSEPSILSSQQSPGDDAALGRCGHRPAT
jgi:hypothetical protein